MGLWVEDQGSRVRGWVLWGRGWGVEGRGYGYETGFVGEWCGGHNQICCRCWSREARDGMISIANGTVEQFKNNCTRRVRPLSNLAHI